MSFHHRLTSSHHLITIVLSSGGARETQTLLGQCSPVQSRQAHGAAQCGGTRCRTRARRHNGSLTPARRHHEQAGKARGQQGCQHEGVR